MRFLSLFSGIEAATVAWFPLGWECVGVSEIEKFPCSILKHHYPNVPNLGDITKITQDQITALGHIDLVVGGFPCQDLSVAGKRAGLKHYDGSNTRSGLFYDAMRIVGWANPRWLVLENVPGLFSSRFGRDFASVVGEMVGCEFNVPRDGWRNAGVAVGQHGIVEWQTLDAQFVRTQLHPRAVPQRRRRVFLIRDSGAWGSRPPLFLIKESLSGNPAPSRNSGERIAPTIRSGAANGGKGHGARSGDSKDELIVPVPHAEISPALKARDGKGVSSDGDGDGDGAILVPMVAFGSQNSSQQGLSCSEHISPTLDKSKTPAVAYDMRGRDGGAQFEGPHDTANIRASNGGSSRSYVADMQVRRLTPLECERLMGFPDSYTDIKLNGKPTPDGPRYKALGNSMAVNCMEWIGRRIQMVEEITNA